MSICCWRWCWNKEETWRFGEKRCRIWRQNKWQGIISIYRNDCRL